MEAKTLTKGQVVQIIGPVVDVEFAADAVPDILDALSIDREDGSKLVLEVQQHLGENRVRAIAMDSTDGLTRGTDVNSTGQAIAMPTGDAIRGRLFNVEVGDARVGIKVPPEFSDQNIQTGQSFLFKIRVERQGILIAEDIQKS